MGMVRSKEGDEKENLRSPFASPPQEGGQFEKTKGMIWHR
jgi:hypothetical protein